MSNHFKKTALGVALAVAACVANDANAMSYLMMRDDALLAQSPVVVSAEVIGELPGAKNAEGYVVDTRYALRVDFVAKGKVDASTLVMKVPGSKSTTEPGLLVHGVPQYAVGDRVLVFAQRAADGTYQPVQLALGLFRETEYAGDLYYVRDLDEADAMEKSFNAEYALPRRADRFVRYIGAKASNRKATVDYLEALPEDAKAKFTLMRDSQGVAVRWTRFDTNQNLPWYSTAAGQAGMTTDEGALVTQATAAWTNDPGSRILMSYAGTVASDLRNGSTDGRSVVSWSDPANEIAGSFSCGSGGTLAIGGPWWSGTNSVVNGVTYRTIVEGFVVMQDGAQCVFDRNQGRDGAETLTHEIGHALGFGHACGDSSSPSCSNATLNDAVMRASIHGDGRGAALRADDQAAAATVYPQPAGGGGAADVIKRDGFE